MAKTGRYAHYRRTPQYRKALAELRARGAVQQCWSCPKVLYVELKWPHPHSITLGHYTAVEDGGDPYDPNNFGPQCIACNLSDGADRTNSKRRGERGRVYVDDDW
ncbi:hypothetical protein QT381_02615 [Galbitalea sp. SE-J8]|uniref:hypothetical protein n=1 Tax=Galbitalea sp. SE-J8 TaxID=3054952 RepID=UPI00259CAE22|nr:hypothetical protein [Galbitalea sp. SE-J8]MDM4761896.1 hypothetical protein [Galbitalea sp. SE-J8]